ncbi:MAG: AhpC/TSA family protein [Clostridium sp.]|nr:AhpC/TSA family protein [Clostridium sp.]
MNKTILTLLAGGFLLSAGCAKAVEPNYSVTVPTDASTDGQQAFLIDYDTSEKLDSTIISGTTINFSGHVGQPVLARVIIGGKRGGTFVLEPGTITLDGQHRASGTPQNEALEKLQTDLTAIVSEFRQLQQDSAGIARAAALEQQYNQTIADFMAANKTTPAGLYMLLQQSGNWETLADFDHETAKYPAFAGSKRLATLRQGFVTREETSPGHMYKDFAVTYDGETKRLSDYVGKGRYTLVDFWASWCGPCIRETRTLKKLYEKYDGKNLDFLGVAVWDEPENTLQAIESHKLPWPQIINAQSIPTDIYGIPAIPCIILFGPDGTILSRGLQGEDLIEAVDAALAE